MSRQLLVLVLVNVLDVEQKQVAHFQKLFVLLHAFGIVGVEGDARRIRAGGYPLRLAKTEQLGNKVDLQQRLTARSSHTALVAVIIFVSHYTGSNVFSGVFRTVRAAPRIGVVAIHTAQRTALHKYHKANSRPIDGAKRFK